MKALSLRQPWANMIAAGEKTIETRTWPTKYRGQILICSSKRPPIRPAGYAIAIADLVDCRPMIAADEKAAGCEMYPGAWSWVLANVKRFEPFQVKGQLGLFEIVVPPGWLERPPKQYAAEDVRWLPGEAGRSKGGS